MRPWPRRLGPVAALLVSCAPLFVLTLHGWTGWVLFLGAFLSLLLLWRGDLPPAQLAPADRSWAQALMIALIAPILAVALSAALRGDTYPAQFDAASRFLLGVPIFLFVLRARVDAARFLRWVLPLALLAALLSLELVGRAAQYPAGRDTTRAVDPLVFGYLSLAFGLMCLASLSPGEWRTRRGAVLLKCAGAALGFYLSLRSGSRTGWVAAPVVIGTWLYLHWGRGHPARTTLVLVATCATPVLAYLLLPTVHERVDLAWQQFATYPWTGVAPVNSIGLRITFLRVAADTFAQHPWTGIGDTQRLPMWMLPTFSYASPEALEGAFHAAFHNQVVSNAVRAGIGGLLATLALLVMPLAVCARQLRRGGRITRENAAMGFAYTLCMFVASMSTEVVDLKALASLYAVMVAVLCGAALATHEPATGPAS